MAESTNEEIEPGQAANTILLLGGLLGLMADRLLWVGGPTGLGFVLWITLFGLATCWLLIRLDVSWLRQGLCWSSVAVLAAVMLLLRTTPMVILALWLLMLVAAAMVLMLRSGKTLRDSTVADQLLSLCTVPLHACMSIIPLLANVEMRALIANPRLRAISRGALLAAPILPVFSLLFASADAVFSRYTEKLMNVFSPNAFSHLLMIAVFGWIATGLLSGVCENRFFKNRQGKPLIKLGTEDTAVFMGLVVALFLLFVFLQLAYLFGGAETIQSTSGLTLAEYARRGFFELLAVAGLTLILLITVSSSNCNQRVFRPLAAILIACVLIILFSAGQRLGMYIAEFGLTIDRLGAASVMLWLAIGLLLFALTILRGRVTNFATGLSITGIVVVFSLVLANPAAVVARINMDRAVNDNRPVDIAYLLSLGSDAVPAIVNRIDRLPLITQCMTARQLLIQWSPEEGNSPGQFQGWRAWNASRSSAENIVLDKSTELRAITRSCPF